MSYDVNCKLWCNLRSVRRSPKKVLFSILIQCPLPVDIYRWLVRIQILVSWYCMVSRLFCQRGQLVFVLWREWPTLSVMMLLLLVSSLLVLAWLPLTLLISINRFYWVTGSSKNSTYTRRHTLCHLKRRRSTSFTVPLLWNRSFLNTASHKGNMRWL